MNKTCIIIAGPTAVGKTAMAIALAKHFSTQIISADSRQCYQELGIAVAKPSPEELSSIHHYFINSHSINNNLSVADFESYALAAVDEIYLRNDVAVMVGGTGLYINAFCQGLDEIPEIDLTIRADIKKQLDQFGLHWLQEEVKKLDPLFYEQGEILNPQRLMRALEVKLSTGQSIISYQQKQKKQRNFNIIKIGLELPREILYQRINNRVDLMIDAGLVKEAETLFAHQHLNALQTVGYRELFDYCNKKITLNRVIELIKQNSRHYAKRQMTWFKKNDDIKWVDMQDPEKSFNEIIHHYSTSKKKPLQ